MPTTYNTSSLSSERKKLRTKMRLTDLETVSPSRRESAKIMTPESRALTTICTKLRRKPTSSTSLLMPRSTSSEELRRLSKTPVLSS